jgi:hypothetical protein
MDDWASLRLCTAYIRGGDIYLVALAKNIFGVFQDIEPFFKISLLTSPSELLLQAPDSYRENVPGKTHVRAVRQPLSLFLAFSGFRSWKSFQKGNQHFSTSSEDCGVEVTPIASRQQGGHWHQPQKAVRYRAQAGQIRSLLLEHVSKS